MIDHPRRIAWWGPELGGTDLCCGRRFQAWSTETRPSTAPPMSNGCIAGVSHGRVIGGLAEVAVCAAVVLQATRRP